MKTTIDRLNVPGVNAPFSRIKSWTLGDSESISLKVSLTDPNQWINGIFENSRFAIFMWHKDHDSRVSLLASGLNMGKFRKCKAANIEAFIKKVNDYLANNS
jgi:hypothetical protein